MTKNKESSKLRKILTEMDKEETVSPAKSILKRIQEREAEDEVKRKVAEQFVEQFTKENGPIKYFQDQWVGTKPWRDAYDKGYQQAQWELEEEHKDIIYKMTMDFYGRQKN
jgi:hypothetical protein